MRRIDAGATIGIALLAFILSYSKLVGLAERAGYSQHMATLWPLIVDGLAVVATMGVMRLQARRWYAWALLVSATLVSMVAAVASAVFPDGPLPPVASALVSVVPPLCLLVAPHLAVQLIREGGQSNQVAVTDVAGTDVASTDVAATDVATGVAPTEVASTDVAVADVAPTQVAPTDVAPPQLFAVAPHNPDRRTQAVQLLSQGVPQREVARRFGVSDTTVRRWRRQAEKVA